MFNLQFLGCLATLSSEASVLTLLTITCDRLMKIVFPFSRYHLTLIYVHKVMFFVWCFVSIIAVVPVIPSSYFMGQFYSRFVYLELSIIIIL